MIRTGIVAVIALVPALAAPALWAQEAAEAVSPRARNYLSRRVVEVFDFDERAMGNYERLPRNWRVVGGPGFPAYTADLTGFDATHRRSGEHGLKLESDGGSSGLVLDRGALAAIPGADYIVTAEVFTKQLTHARVRMVGYFVDQHGRRIEPSMAHSGLVRSNGQWTRLRLELDGDYEQAAWIVLRLELLQSDAFRRPVMGRHELYREDIGAAAWFDDVSIFQLPRIEMVTESPTNILRAPNQPRVFVTVRDLTGETLESRLTLYDEAGRTIAHQRRVLDGRHAPQWTWAPKVPRFGWYWADLQVTGERGLVGRRLAAFCWLPAGPQRTADSHRFGIVAEGLPQPQRMLLPRVLERLGTGAVITDVWNERMTRADLVEMEKRPDPVLAELIGAQPRVTLSLAGVPQELALLAKTDPDMPLALLAADPQTWKRPLQATLVRYGQQVRRWQIGGVDSREAFWRDDLPRLYPRLHDWFDSLVPEATVVLPWSAQHEMGEIGRQVGGVHRHIPPSIRPDHLRAYARTWPETSEGPSLVIEALPAGEHDHTQRVEDFALRLVEAWAVDPGAVYAIHPWNQAHDPRVGLIPDPLLAVYANTIDRLAERRVVGSMRLAEGVRCYILDGPSGGALAAWNQSSPDSDVALDMYLGERPRLFDVWGNSRVLTGEADGGTHRVPIGAAPVFIEGIDAKLARFRAAMRFDPNFLESSYKVHRVALNLSNPWERTISGRLRIDSLPDWTIHPRVIRFNIPAGESIQAPLDVTFPISELAGEKIVSGSLELDADRSYRIEVATPLEIGLPDIDYHPTLSVEPRDDGTTDVVLTALVTNRGEEPRSLYAFAIAPGRPSQQRIVARLQPQQTTVKRFRFAAAAAELSGQSIRAGLREMDGPAMLNQKLDVP